MDSISKISGAWKEDSSMLRPKRSEALTMTTSTKAGGHLTMENSNSKSSRHKQNVPHPFDAHAAGPSV